MFIQCKELVERTTANTVTLAPLPTGITLIPPESASAVDIQDKNSEGKPWLFQRISNHYPYNDGQIKFFLNWDTNYEAIWEPCSIVPKEAISRDFARMRRAVLERYEYSSEMSPKYTTSIRLQKATANQIISSDLLL